MNSVKNIVVSVYHKHEFCENSKNFVGKRLVEEDRKAGVSGIKLERKSGKYGTEAGMRWHLREGEERKKLCNITQYFAIGKEQTGVIRPEGKKKELD